MTDDTEIDFIPSLHERRKRQIINDAVKISNFLGIECPMIHFKKNKRGGWYSYNGFIQMGLVKYKRFFIIHELIHAAGLRHRRNLCKFGVKGNFMSHGNKDTFSKRLERIIFT